MCVVFREYMTCLITNMPWLLVETRIPEGKIIKQVYLTVTNEFFRSSNHQYLYSWGLLGPDAV